MADAVAAPLSPESLVAFLVEKAAKARASAKSRRYWADVGVNATEEQKKAARALNKAIGHPTPKISKEEELRLSAIDKRIAVKDDAEAEIFDAVIAALEQAQSDREGRQQAEEALKREVNEFIEAMHDTNIRHEKELRTAEAERDEARKDAAFHSDCRPNRREAEAAMADAKAVNDRNADLIREKRELEAALHDARAQVLREVADYLISQRQGGQMDHVVHVFDVLASEIRQDKFPKAESIP